MQDRKVFLDSNIVIYAYSSSEMDKRQISRKLAEENYLVISTQVLQELTNTLRRKFQLPYTAIREMLEECIATSNEIYVNTKQTVLLACDIAERHHFSFYDSLIIASAIESGCDVLYTEDLQHNQIIESKLSIINPYLI